jgi:hypothetical protein
MTDGPRTPTSGDGAGLHPVPVQPAAPEATGSAPAGAGDRPEVLVAGAFAGGLLAAMILKRMAR